MKTTESVELEQETEDKKSTPNTFFILSTTLFAIICAVSIFLFFENMSLNASIDANKNEIATYVSSINKIKSDKKVIAAELVTNNKSSILASIQMSDAQKYIDEVLTISRKYKLIFSGFSYANGKINTSAVSIPETVLFGDDGVKKVSNLVRDYRTGTGLLFNLSPVLSISGYEQKRAFSLEFNVAGVK
ncbi:hypothetical protein GW819_02880 [Candidatus Gracilibacteria bacterium]|nr:hypothetical protein [bacterium]NDK19758.1 hypothetical protein [Candidatus Gracilibacteria bacterium]OIO77067.1 MAG: hypothetical protein AUJ87_01850 [Candidatus Gracilibacteria bacterium CG1_02_38_174]PIQ11546.1 MAG: hypothetical protein COW68_02420 [Candidatus Gracilibacteria bacterium CG18_big_fil_WC_8_21_14_2_50_38_16]PIQ42284.1 MAG: hypothetical protein COW06_00050 [Candidatus Gracilibacteria bacterium CG12_big_fil_rev_8_21_14_0_65_38_15]PIZ02036.1 MAG: hypothetical protein COY60_0048